LTKKKKQQQEQKDERHDSKKLFDYANGHIHKTVISTYDASKVYGLVEVHNHFETLELNSNRAVQWLSHDYHRVDPNIIHSPDFFKNCLHAIISTSIMNGTIKEKVHKRIAQKDNAIYYDLGSKDWKAIKITKRAITKVRINENTPLFVRPSSLYEQVEPKYEIKDVLDDFANLLLILDNDKIVFKCNLVALFLEEYAIPMPVAVGSAGSSKSTFTAYVKQVVDPSGKHKENNLIGFPKKTDDLVAIESHRYMIGFDNVSEIDQEMSDELCRAITGGSTSNRKLYTNLDESISSYKNKIILNGIVPRLNYPDLQTRIITYPRKPLDKSNTLTEEKLEKIFQYLLPNVLGSIFQTLQKALKAFPIVSKQIKPIQRMADFEVWGEVIAQCLGYKQNEFLEAYDRKLKEDVINQKDQHIIVNLIETIMEGKDVYENQAKTLLSELTFLAKDEDIDIKSQYVYFPKLPNQLTRELTIVDPILKRLGFLVETYPYNKRDGVFKRNSRIVKISRTNYQEPLTFGNSSLSSLSSLSDKKQARKSTKSGMDEKKLSLSHPCQSDTVTEMTEIQKNLSRSQNTENRHENRTDRDDKYDKDDLKKVSSPDDVDPQKPYWQCFRCNQKGTEIQHISYHSPNGTTIENHLKSHPDSVKFLTKKEAKMERNS